MSTPSEVERVCPICGVKDWCLRHGYPTGVAWREDPEHKGQFVLDVLRDGWEIEVRVSEDDGTDFYAKRVGREDG